MRLDQGPVRSKGLELGASGHVVFRQDPSSEGGMSTDTKIPLRPGSGAARRQAQRRKKSHPRGTRPLVIVGVVVALIAVALLIAVAAGGGNDTVTTDDASGVQETRPVTVTGDLLVPFDTTENDAAVGATAPRIDGSTFSGVEMSLPVKGTPTLLVFLAHWCPHCQAEVPLLTEWDAQGSVPDGVEVFGIATATDPAAVNYPPSRWLEDEGFPFAVLVDNDSSDAGVAMGVTGYPAFVMLDAQGRVEWRTSGELPVEELQAMIEASLAPS